jgi:putative ABC transport system ATP-binding protein
MEEPLYCLEKVSRIYEADTVRTYALFECSFRILPGEFVVVTGPSGAGKTTLLHLLALLDAPSAGELTFLGRPTASLSLAQRALIRNLYVGVVLQQAHLVADMRVWENVALPLRYRGLARGEARSRSLAALEKVGLGHRAFHYPHQLSGGEQQRAAVARALVGEPKVLLADEPTGNLDRKQGREVMELVSAAAEGGCTVVLVTHDPEWAAWGRRRLVLLDGRLVEDAPLPPGGRA